MSNLSLGVELFLTTLFLFLLNFFQVLFSLVMKDNRGKRLQHEYQLLLEAKSQQKKVSLKQSQKLNSSFFPSVFSAKYTTVCMIKRSTN